METLLVGNMVMILFWIFMTLIANDAEKYKVIVLLYIITYLVNILKFEYKNWGCGRNPGPNEVINRRRSRTCIPTKTG